MNTHRPKEGQVQWKPRDYYSQNVAYNTQTPHIRGEPNALIVYNLWGDELWCTEEHFDIFIGIKFPCHSEVD